MPLGDTDQYDCCKAQQWLMTIQLMSSVDGLETYGEKKTLKKNIIFVPKTCVEKVEIILKNEMGHNILCLKN